MLTIIFLAAMAYVVWKLFVLGVKATWGIAKFVCAVILFPAVLIGLVFAGLLYIAVPILLVVGIIVLVKYASSS